MEELLNILTSPTVRLGSAYFGAAFWAFMYFNLRRKVKASEIRKGEVIDEAAEVVNKRSNGKVKKAYAMGVMFGLSQLKNLVIKESDNG